MWFMVVVVCFSMFMRVRVLSLWRYGAVVNRLVRDGVLKVRILGVFGALGLSTFSFLFILMTLFSSDVIVFMLWNLLLVVVDPRW